MSQTPARTSEIVQIALAEFAGIRAEMDQKWRAHDTLVGLSITLNAGLVGLVLADSAPVELLVLTPLLSTALTLVRRRQLWVASILAAYIRDVLQPILAEAVDDPRVLRFEDFYFPEFLRRRAWFVHPIADNALMPVASITILALVAPYLDGTLEWTGWILGGLASLLLLAESTRAVVRMQFKRAEVLRRKLTPAQSILRRRSGQSVAKKR